MTVIVSCIPFDLTFFINNCEKIWSFIDLSLESS